MMQKAIVVFAGPHKFLSNFEKVLISYDGLEYASVEHAYQAAKAQSLGVREKFSIYATPPLTASKAKQLGRKIDLREDWEQVREEVMLDLLRLKFKDPVLREKLLATGSAKLVEGNWWGDTFWGVCRGVGQNKLGKLLMQVRKELKETK